MEEYWEHKSPVTRHKTEVRGLRKQQGVRSPSTSLRTLLRTKSTRVKGRSLKTKKTVGSRA